MVESKDLLAYLGSTAESLESFKEEFQGRFITKESAPDEEQIKSHTVGKFSGVLKGLAKKGFGLEQEEIDSCKKWEDILALGFAKKEKQIEELKVSSHQTSDALVTELNSKLERANQTAREYKDANELIKNSLAEQEQQWDGKLKQTKASFAKQQALFSIKDKLSNTLTKGDNLLLNQEIDSLQIEFGDNDNDIIVKDREGKRISNPKQVGTFLGLSEAIEFIAEKEGFVKKNNATATASFVSKQGQTHTDKGVQGIRQIHPNAR